MEAITKWALAIVDRMPDIPASNLLAFIVIGFAVLGLARKAKRVVLPSEGKEAVPMVLLDAASVYTVLTDLQISVQRLNARAEMIEQMCRRRQKPVHRRRKKPAPSAESA